MSDSPYDARAVANLLLDEADRGGYSLSNLALQKLLYFCHGNFLVRRKAPLLQGHFEAWEYGPVHPLVYKCFKAAGADPITFRARKTDIVSGEEREVSAPEDKLLRRVVWSVLYNYGHMTPGQLVAISHAKDGPWDYIANKTKTSVAFGHRIPENVILARFGKHIVSISDWSHDGDDLEEVPLTGN